MLHDTGPLLAWETIPTDTRPLTYSISVCSLSMLFTAVTVVTVSQQSVLSRIACRFAHESSGTSFTLATRS